ncbi:MAG: YaeQ family protein [Acidobacteriota bacterium]
MRLTFRIRHRYPGRAVHEEKLVVATEHGEMPWHIALKLLAYLRFIDHRPQIEKRVGGRYKPDLVDVDDRGRVRLWIECGNIGPRKIASVARRVAREDGRFIILKRHRGEVTALARLLDGRVATGTVDLLAFDDHFVDRMTAVLDANNTMDCTLSEAGGRERLHLMVDNRHGRTELQTEIVSHAL